MGWTSEPEQDGSLSLEDKLWRSFYWFSKTEQQEVRDDFILKFYMTSIICRQFGLWSSVCQPLKRCTRGLEGVEESESLLWPLGLGLGGMVPRFQDNCVHDAKHLLLVKSINQYAWKVTNFNQLCNHFRHLQNHFAFCNAIHVVLLRPWT